MSRNQTVEVKVKIPKAVYDLIRATTENPEQYLTKSIIQVVYADLDAGALAGPETKPERLTAVFREHGLAQ